MSVILWVVFSFRLKYRSQTVIRQCSLVGVIQIGVLPKPTRLSYSGETLTQKTAQRNCNRSTRQHQLRIFGTFWTLNLYCEWISEISDFNNWNIWTLFICKLFRHHYYYLDQLLYKIVTTCCLLYSFACHCLSLAKDWPPVPWAVHVR